MKPFDIFKTGSHRDSKGRDFNATESILVELAESYDPALSGAPFVVGHPKMDDPAYGWADKLTVKDGVLFAHPVNVEPTFGEMVQDGRFPNRSISIYGPDDPANPKPGTHYLKHIGFLGAAAPAVKGLRAVEFNGEDDALEFTGWQDPEALDQLSGLSDLISSATWLFRNLSRMAGLSTKVDEGALVSSFAETEVAPQTISNPTQSDLKGDLSVTDEDKLNADKAAFEQEKRDFAEAQAKRRRADDEALVDAAVADGRVTPANRDAVLAFAGSLDDGDAFEFGEGDGKTSVTPRAFFARLLQSATPAINFSELSKDDGLKAGEAPDASDIAREARSFQAEQAAKGITISITDAVATVSKRAAA